MKRWTAALLALALILFGGAYALAEENLILNGDFSEMEGENPLGWRRDMWLTDEGISRLDVESDGFEGNCVSVWNVDENDARYAQTVSVQPNTLYRVSGMVRAEGCDTEGHGASISFKDVFEYTDPIYDTRGQWSYVEIYGRTGPQQTSLDVFVRVGGYGALAAGRAWFDDIEMVEVDEAPQGVFVHDLFRVDTGSNDNSKSTNVDEPERFTEAWLLFSAIYVLMVVGVVRKRGRAAMTAKKPNETLCLCLLLAVALIVRVITALRVPGYNTDINCFTAWSERIFSKGLLKFYDPEYFCDYPPGYMLLLWPVALFRNILGLQTGTAAYRALLKLLPMLCDLAGAYVVWRVARKHKNAGIALLLAGLYAFNPAAIANSAGWGQIDALLTLFIVLCALRASEGKYARALLWFTAALLVKPQALLFAPLGLVAILVGICRADDAEIRRKKVRGLLIGTAACLGMLYAVAFVFCIGRAEGVLDALTLPVRWMIKQYSGTMQGYRYVTVNTLNFWCLLGLNWAHAESHTAAMVVAWVLYALSYVYTAALCVRSAKKPWHLLLLGATLIMLISAFGPMMHERYVFPAMLLLALAFALEGDVRLLVGLTVLTATLFLNEVLVLQGGMTAANYGHLQSGEQWLNATLSVIVVLNALFMAWTAFDICLREHVIPLWEVAREEMPAGQATLKRSSDYRMNLKRMDYLLMAVITLAYSVVAYANLGVTKAPQTAWTSSASGESVVFDLGDIETFRMTYYGGICNSTFTVALSNDGEVWTDEVYAKYDQGEIFRWLWFVPLDENQSAIYNGALPPDDGAAHFNYATAGNSYPFQTARYVRITARSPGLKLLEIGFLDNEGHALPIVDYAQTGQLDALSSDAANLLDEQDTVAEYPSYINSSYFDEIYHARTAYEHLHGLNTYEWTHPPLGKVWMMLGVQLFGMTPFGWRFMGVFAGVLMVPLMYLLVKQLTKDTKLAFIAMCLLALDSMHFTQTRLATIDSYAVFWIMLMYLFMFRYCQMNWNHVPFRKTLLPLGLCGVTMGIACATKWIGIYAATGLAVLFFWTLFRRLRERRFLPEGAKTWCYAWITVGFCVVFFVLIPLVIYYFSYYWHLRGEGLSGFAGMFSIDRVKRVIQIQKNMLGYHAGLGGDTHYFRSPWYQWPIIWWPMWYYSGTAYLPEGMVSSISCMGNPAVWWFGLLAIIYVFFRVCLSRRTTDARLMVVIGFAAQFLPWVLVPRSTFIYHYFASVPFIIMASVLVLGDIRAKSESAFKLIAGLLLAAAAVLFGLFYPLESGVPAAKSYVKYLRWFKWYNY